MKTSTPTNSLRRRLIPIPYLVALFVGGKYGYDEWHLLWLSSRRQRA